MRYGSNFDMRNLPNIMNTVKDPTGALSPTNKSQLSEVNKNLTLVKTSFHKGGGFHKLSKAQQLLI